MHGPLYPSSGVLRYTRDSAVYRLTLDVDTEVARYYRALIPWWVATNKPRYTPHVTVVRPEKESPACPEHWGKYDGEAVDFDSGPLKNPFLLAPARRCKKEGVFKGPESET